MNPDEPTVDELHVAKLQSREIDAAQDYFASRRAKMAQEEAPPAQAASAPDKDSGRSVDDLVRGGAKKETFTQAVLRNLSPLGALGGLVQGAVAEPIRMGHDIDQALGLPRLVIGGEDGLISIQSAEESKDVPSVGDLVPNVGPEGLAKNVGQFIGGFALASKLLAPVATVQKVAQSGKLGAGAVAAVKGAISDFASFSGMANPVNGLVQAFPSLEGPVTEFMDSDEDDPALVQRLKSALVGVGLGVATDTIIGGIRGIRGMMRAKPALESADEVIKQAEAVMTDQKAVLTDLLGDPDDARILVPAPAQAADDATGFAGKAGEDITGPRPNEANRVGDVYINWARIDSPDDVKTVLGEMANRYSDSIDTARGGAYQSHAQVKLDAREVDALKIIEDRRLSNKAVPLPAHEMQAVRDLWVGSGRKLRDLTRRVNANGGKLEQLAFRKQLETHAEIQNVYMGARTATARALGSMRIPAGDAADWTMGMEGAIAQLDMSKTTEQIAAGIAALDHSLRGDAAETFIDIVAKNLDKGSDMVRQYWYFSLLSGPKTHARNMLSNTAMLGANVATRKGANLLGQMLGEENVVAGEATAKLFGDLEGVRAAFRVDAKLREMQRIPEAANALRRFWASVKSTPVGKALIDGEPGFGLGKPEARQIGAFDPTKVGVDPETMLGRGLSLMDTITSTTSRGLMAADEVFKMANFHGELNSVALRQAMREVESGALTRDAVSDRVAELVTNPSSAMRLMAMREAGFSTFTNEPANTALWKFVKSAQRVPIIGRIAAPFLRTPYNVFTEMSQWNPALAPITKRFRTEMAAGGARADIAMSKLALGSMMLVEMSRWAVDGYLRGEGGELNPKAGKRDTMARAGQLPMTLTVPTADGRSRSFSFRGLEPFSTHMGFAANLVDLMSSDEFGDEDRDLSDLVIASGASIASSILNASFVQGFTDLTEFLSDPMRYSESYAENLFGTLIPALSRDIAQAQDPTLREVNSLFDAVRVRIPGVAEGVPAKLDAWGRPITKASGLGKSYDALSPFYSTPVNPEPVDAFLIENDIWIGKPQKDASFDGVTVNLRNKPEIYRDYLELQGQGVTETVNGEPIRTSFGYTSEGGNLLAELNAIVNGDHAFSAIWNQGSDGPEGDKSVWIKEIIRTYRREALFHLVEKHPELRAEIKSRAAEQPERRFKRAKENAFLVE